MYVISFYVPQDHLDQVKNAMFKAGAGKIGNYSCCAWQTKGQGQFMPLSGSNPTIGSHFHIETVDEYKVEIVCAEEYLQDVIAALHAAHPYEVPAYHVMRTEDI